MRLTLFGLVLAALAACSPEAPPQPAHRPATDIAPGRVDIGGVTVSLPQRIGEWTRADAAKRVTADTIFDYMDGAGELYLAYRFDHLDAVEYKTREASPGTILVEIYSMQTADDAFGLLSNDWGGEAMAFDAGSVAGQPRLRAVPPRRALHGAGLLRMWAGDRYVRILASRETPESRGAVQQLGEAILKALPEATPPPPVLLRGFDAQVDARRPLRPERTCFFRSHLVLNSQYFLASQDILGLGPDVAAGTTEFAPAAAGERAVRAILVRYPSEARALAGLASFSKAYVTELASNAAPRKGEAHVEHGWVGWSLKDEGRLTIVLDAADRSTARRFAEALVPAISD